MIHILTQNRDCLHSETDLELIRVEVHLALKNAQRAVERAELMLLRLARHRMEKDAIDVARFARRRPFQGLDSAARTSGKG